MVAVRSVQCHPGKCKCRSKCHFYCARYKLTDGVLQTVEANVQYSKSNNNKTVLND